MPTMVAHPPLILLVDDDPESLDILSRLLDTFMYHAEIVAVESGAAALAVTIARPAALVIADYHMPEMNGVELTSRIKTESPTTHIAIVSVDDRDDVAREAKAVAADYVLPKPYMLA